MGQIKKFFEDRAQAAELLAQALVHYRGKNPLVLGVPRGAVPMARQVADSLAGELDVVLVHKIALSGNPEFAVGSVSELGDLYYSKAAASHGVSAQLIEFLAKAEVTRLRHRRQSYSPIRPPIPVKGRLVILMDDGIATGATLFAAIRAIRAQGPQKLIVATPVAPQALVPRLKGEVDELIVLETPGDFFSISDFYEKFPQVSDEEVLAALAGTKDSAWARQG